MKELILKGDMFYKKKESLQEVKNDNVNWKTYYIDLNTHEKWIQEYPYSEYHGGGEPQLRLIPKFPWEKQE